MELAEYVLEQEKGYVVGMFGGLMGLYVALERGDWLLAVISVSFVLALFRLVLAKYDLFQSR